jgi:general nucleoside transport system permease protein
MIRLRLVPRVEPSQRMLVYAPLLAVALTLVVGLTIFAALGQNPLHAFRAFFVDPISNINGVSELLLKASPLCLIALGLAIGYRANIWNIGAEGQMYLGGIFASGFAIYFHEAGGGFLLPAMIFAAALGGALWASITALCRAQFHANEILVSLMLTYVADLLVKYLVYGPWKDPMANNFPVTISFGDDALFAPLASFGWAFWEGTRINTSVFITLAAIPLAWFFMERSFSGFQLLVAGVAPGAARYAGFRERRMIWLALIISGVAAGIAGATEVAGPMGQLNDRWTPGYGFTAIIVATLGRLHAVGIVIASLLMALLYLGGEAVQVSMQLPKAVSQVFQGLLLMFLLGCDVMVNYRIVAVSRAGSAAARS